MKPTETNFSTIKNLFVDNVLPLFDLSSKIETAIQTGKETLQRISEQSAMHDITYGIHSEEINLEKLKNVLQKMAKKGWKVEIGETNIVTTPGSDDPFMDHSRADMLGGFTSSQQSFKVMTDFTAVKTKGNIQCQKGSNEWIRDLCDTIGALRKNIPDDWMHNNRVEHPIFSMLPK